MEVTEELRSVCSMIAKAVHRYMIDKEHRKEFERWYEERYGRKYEWKS